MTNIQPVTANQTSPRSKELLDGIQKKLGMVPNMMRTLAHSPVALEAYTTLSGVLGGSSFTSKQREELALLAAEENCCQYCLSAHSVIGQKVGLTHSEIESARNAESSDPKMAAALAFTRELIVEQGAVDVETIGAARHAGITDGEISELVAIAALNIFTNYFNHVADPEIDFPKVELCKADSCSCS